MAEMEVEESKDLNEEKKEEVAKDEAAQEAEGNEGKELEADAPSDARPKVKAGSVALNFEESTLNAVPVNGGKMLMSLTEGGMQHLLACVRANTGIKSGRYMFEVRILETLQPFEQPGARVYMPRQLLRVGLSQSSSSLFLADGLENLSFDCDGTFVHHKSRTRTNAKFWKDQTVAWLLNLDPKSPNANTVSLFIDGQRATEPIQLPEEMKGKTLYPTVNYKNMSLEVNFGPVPRAALPFTCHMLQQAAAEDVEVKASTRKDGKSDFVLPVALPDMGYFDWVDKFLAENPGYVELSDRMILDWAAKSGIWNRKNAGAGSNDKPEANTGVIAIDDWSISRVMAAVAPTMPRNYVVPELKANLVPAERKDALERFTSDEFQRRAIVLMGQPDDSYREYIQKKMLEEKEWQAELEKKRKAQEAERKRQMDERKRKAQEAQRSLELAKKRKLAQEAGEEEPGDEELPEAPEAPVEAEAAEEAAPVTLTEEEKALKYLPSTSTDIAERELARSYASFALPQKSEGFEKVEFVWEKEAACSALLKSWVLEKKQTQRAEDLVPGAEFKQEWQKWQKVVGEWRRSQSDFKDPSKRKAAQDKKAEDAKKLLEEEKQTLIEAGDEDGAKALEEKAQAEAAEAEAKEELDMENLDVFAVEDIKDIGNGEPLFANFGYEDWILLSTRFELHLLIHSFKRDLDDADRPSFPLKHLSYYYHKYYRKAWNFQQFSVPEFDDLLELLKDSISLQGDGQEGHLKADDAADAPPERFVKLTEDNRRERQRRIDAGDETARLKFARPAASFGAVGAGSGGGGKGSYGKGKRPYPQLGAAQQASAQAVAYNSNKPRTTYAPQTKGGPYAPRQSYGRG